MWTGLMFPAWVKGEGGHQMSRRPVKSALARVRAERRELRKLMARVSEIAKERLREAIEEGLIEGRIEEDGEIVIIVDDTIEETEMTTTTVGTDIEL
jgi:hypothetical protein